MLAQFIRCEEGFVVSSELVLLATILVVGLIVGQTTARDQIVTEIGDVADAVSAIDHGYAFSDVSGHTATTAGTVFDDTLDFCDLSDDGSQGNGRITGTCMSLGFARREAGVPDVTNDSN